MAKTERVRTAEFRTSAFEEVVKGFAQLTQDLIRVSTERLKPDGEFIPLELMQHGEKAVFVVIEAENPNLVSNFRDQIKPVAIALGGQFYLDARIDEDHEPEYRPGSFENDGGEEDYEVYLKILFPNLQKDS